MLTNKAAAIMRADVCAGHATHVDYVDGVEMVVQRHFDGRTLTTHAYSTIMELTPERPLVPMWDYVIDATVINGYVHGVSVRTVRYRGDLFEKVICTHAFGMFHGATTRVTLCDSPSGSQRWRLAETTWWDRGVCVRTVSKLNRIA